MDLSFSAEELEFRDEVRAFLGDRLPEEISTRVMSGFPARAEQYRRWQNILYQQGWGAPTWPKKFGGTGWTAVQQHIF